MLNVSGTTRVLVATTPVDLRGSFNRLYGLVVEQLKSDLFQATFTCSPIEGTIGLRFFGGMVRDCSYVPKGWSAGNLPFR